MDSLAYTVFELGKVGYQTDLREQSYGLTHYRIADSCLYEVDGQIRKFGGTEKINSVAITSTPTVTGLYDFHFGGGATAFSQKFIAVTANGKIYKEDMDGTFDDITGAATITTSAIPVFCTAKNLLVIAFHTRDAILKWDGATAAVSALGGSAPLGKGFIYHANRGWIWDGSILYYSAYDNVENWIGGDAGKLTINTGDGDEIRGAAVYKENLVIFKGPSRGSIHFITGRSPATFTRIPLVTGIPLHTHNSIIPVGDDVAFMSPRGIHLLSSVQQYGNYAEADITRYLKGHFRSKINRNNLYVTQGVNYGEKSCLLWSTTTVGSLVPDQIFGLSYIRLAEDGWKPFTVSRPCFSLGIRRHPNTGLYEVMSGGTSDGFVRRQDAADRNLDDAPYNINLKSPKMIVANADAGGRPRGDQPAVIYCMYVRSESVGEYPLTALIVRDNAGPDQYHFNLGRTGGFLLDTSILDVDFIGDDSSVEIAYSDPPGYGEFRTFQFQLNQAVTNQDAKLIEFGLGYKQTAQIRQNLTGPGDGFVRRPGE